MWLRLMAAGGVLLVIPSGWFLLSATRPAVLPPLPPAPAVRTCRDYLERDAYTPPDLSTGIDRYLACVPGLRERIKALNEAEFVQTTWAEGNRSAWLSAPDPQFRQWFEARGLKFADDIHAVFLSAAWHRVRGVEFDLALRVQCHQAWNWILAYRLEQSGGRYVEVPKFRCSDDAEVLRGRRLWTQE
jgi:hypothetical protein